jgi:predicted O-methyltransferase YrrM
MNALFPPTLVEMLQTGKVIDRHGKIRIADTISTQNNLHTIAALLQQKQPQKTLEIGLCYGASALLFTNWFRQQGKKPQQQHTAIDPFQARDWGETALHLLEQEQLIHYLQFYQNFSGFVLPNLIQQQQKYDLIYIDGSHLFEDVFIDCYYSIELLTPNGILLLDDCSDAHIKKVVKFITNNCSNLLQPFDLLPFSKRKGWQRWKYKVGYALHKVQLRAFQKISQASRRAWNAPFVEF